MGNIGSGRNKRFASRTDAFHQLDLTTFNRDWFAHYFSGTLSWSRGGRKTATIGFRLAPDHMVLAYSVAGQDKYINERLNFEFTTQNFGGTRRWIICPACGERCRVLLGGTYFRCRQCHRATCPSQYEFLRVPGLSSAETHPGKTR